VYCSLVVMELLSVKLNYKVGLKVLAGAYCIFAFRKYNRFNNMKLLFASSEY
jgi:hypothetical protein